MAMHWLTKVYDPISRKRCPGSGKRLLILDGHASHGINRDIFFPIYKQARAKTYTVENIKAAFKVTGIVPLNPRVVLSQLSKRTARSRQPTGNSITLENTPYTRHDLRQQT